MDDFIRPNKQKPIKPKKKDNKELFIILLIVICLGVGFLAGYYSREPEKGDTKTVNSNQSVVEEAYEILNDNWVNASDKKVDIQKNSIAGMVSSLGDIHSEYWTIDEADSFNESVNGNYQGIGVVFSEVSSGIMIVKVTKDSPAQKSGIQVGDIFTKADGTTLVGKTVDEVKKLVRGQPGTKVKLEMIRQGKNKEVEVTREALETAVRYEIREENHKKFGYIEISTFGTSTAAEVEEALKKFQTQKINELVIDLRNNGGGYVTAADDLLDLFFDSDQVIYKMQEKSGPAKETKAKSDHKYTFDKGFILVNGNTASASELTAGALQQVLHYQLIGSQTYGKGTAQTQKTLSDGSVLKYTYAKWMLPDGTCVHDKGLTPDIKVDNISVKDILTTDIKETLSVDCVNTGIQSMQKMLNILGFDCGRDDGYFSTQSESALKQFETKYSLTVDGKYDNSDKQRLVCEVLIYLNQAQNDRQYNKLLTIL